MVSENQSCPRIGVPYRTRNEEVKDVRKKYGDYLRAIEQAGGTSVEISLVLPSNELQTLVETLDALVLPGSPADVNPARSEFAEPVAQTIAIEIRPCMEIEQRFHVSSSRRSCQ